MASAYIYRKTISNSYLGQLKEIKAKTEHELDMKVSAQLEKWAEREQIARAKADAETSSEGARSVQTRYGLILAHSISRALPDWSSFYDHKHFAPFAYEQPEPTYERTAQELGVPKPMFLDGSFLFRGRLARRLEMEREAREVFEARLHSYRADRETAELAYNDERNKFLADQDRRNNTIDEMKLGHARGESAGLEWYARQAVRCVIRIPSFELPEPDLQHLPDESMLILNMQLPHPDQISTIIGYKFSNTEKASVPVLMKKREAEALYENVCYQAILAGLAAVMRSTPPAHISVVVANGWVDGIDKATGRPFRSCLMSCQTTRETIHSLDLERVEPKQCFRNLKGLAAGPLSGLAPVRPIMNINREDSRFIESRDVLTDVEAIPNLAQMDWEDFEHLVRGLFEKVFGQGGAEVKITRASRDQGVDAIAFDPDPIRGGKFIIQAKRYVNVVPVAAVRDLYGAVINEGASKGILVTTSHYGPEAREFVKDKPLVLIDGQNLLHMFNEHGYAVRIDTSAR